MKASFSLLIIAIITLFSSNSLEAQDVHEMLRKFNAAVNQHKQLEYDFTSKERRRDGSYITTVGHFKVDESSPKKVAGDLTEPEKAKLLWRKGENNDKVLAKPGNLMYVPLKTTSSRFLNKSHHTIDQTGFHLPQSTIMKIYNDRKSEIDEGVTFHNDVNFDGKTCMYVTITDKHHGTTSYTVKEGDNLTKIAYSRAINQMQILELNPGIKNYWDVKAGDKITIPNSAGTKITIYVDKATYMPLYFKVEDKKGLLGEYSHKNLNLNPTFNEVSFTKEGFN